MTAQRIALSQRIVFLVAVRTVQGETTAALDATQLCAIRRRPVRNRSNKNNLFAMAE